MSYSVDLTERDVRILSFLKEQGVATSFQLEKRFFPSADTFRVRIAKLIRAKLIETVSLCEGYREVPSRMMEFRNTLAEMGLKWQQVRLYRLSKSMSGRGSTFEASFTEPIFWQHQIALTEVRQHLERILLDGVFVSDPESKREWARYKFGSEVPIPDLVWRKDAVEIAVEFERTDKGSNRYFERMARYQRSFYKRILFVANTDDIADRLIGCSSRFPRIGVTSRSDLNKVFVGLSGYTTLVEFLLGAG